MFPPTSLLSCQCRLQEVSTAPSEARRNTYGLRGTTMCDESLHSSPIVEMQVRIAARIPCCHAFETEYLVASDTYSEEKASRVRMKCVQLRSIRLGTPVHEFHDVLPSCDFLECLTSFSVRLLIALSKLSAMFGSATVKLHIGLVHIVSHQCHLVDIKMAMQ